MAHAPTHHHEHDQPLAAAACASVALDIGEGRGALVLYPGERFRGREIEISRVGEAGVHPPLPPRRVHTGVHERQADARWLLTAIFGSLPAGDYQVWEDDATPGPLVNVPERSVAEVELP